MHILSEFLWFHICTNTNIIHKQNPTILAIVILFSAFSCGHLSVSLMHTEIAHMHQCIQKIKFSTWLSTVCLDHSLFNNECPLDNYLYCFLLFQSNSFWNKSVCLYIKIVVFLWKCFYRITSQKEIYCTKDNIVKNFKDIAKLSSRHLIPIYTPPKNVWRYLNFSMPSLMLSHVSSFNLC